MNTIEIAGKAYPISFGFGALMYYETETGKPATALFVEFSQGQQRLTDVALLIACGLNNGARRSGFQDVYTKSDVADMLDEDEYPMEVVTRAMTLLAESFAPPDVKKSPAKTAKLPKVMRQTGAR